MGAWLSVLDLLKAQIDCSYFFIGQCSILCTELVDFPWFNIRPDPLASFSGSNSLLHFCLNDFLWHIPSPLIIVQFPCRLIWIRKSWVRFQCCKLLSSQIWATLVSCVRHMVVPNYEWLLTASLVVLCDQPANLVCCYSSYYIINVTYCLTLVTVIGIFCRAIMCPSSCSLLCFIVHSSAESSVWNFRHNWNGTTMFSVIRLYFAS